MHIAHILCSYVFTYLITGKHGDLITLNSTNISLSKSILGTRYPARFLCIIRSLGWQSKNQTKTNSCHVKRSFDKTIKKIIMMRVVDRLLLMTYGSKLNLENMSYFSRFWISREKREKEWNSSRETRKKREKFYPIKWW